MFWEVKRTCIPNVICANKNNREFNAAYITSPYYGVPRVKISQYMDIRFIFFSESLLYELLNLCTGGQRPRFHQPSASAWPQRTNWRMEAAFCQEVPPPEVMYLVQENELSATTGPLLQNAKANWLWHNHKKIPDPGRLSLSLPLDTHMHRHENDHFILLLYWHFWA